jgi:hypothetical protein
MACILFLNFFASDGEVVDESILHSEERWRTGDGGQSGKNLKTISAKGVVKIPV